MKVFSILTLITAFALASPIADVGITITETVSITVFIDICKPTTFAKSTTTKKPTSYKPTSTKPTSTKPTSTKLTATKPTSTKPTSTKPKTTSTASPAPTCPAGQQVYCCKPATGLVNILTCALLDVTLLGCDGGNSPRCCNINNSGNLINIPINQCGDILGGGILSGGGARL